MKNIYSYAIQSNGALKYVGAKDIQTAPGESCDEVADLLLDHTGASLYAYVRNAACSGGQGYDSLKINNTPGALTYQSTTGSDEYLGSPLTMLSNNIFAYSALCNFSVPEIAAFQRPSSGTLQPINVTPFPSGTPPVQYICPEVPTADTTNHPAMSYYNSASGQVADQIATYTVNPTTGDLSTQSSWSNMPKSAVYTIVTVNMAPSGKILAVADEGSPAFQLRRTSQATPRTGLLTTAQIGDLHWDNKNHLYATSYYSNKLFVFTVTSAGVTQAPGSPYTIPKPVHLIVQPK